jgi:hypothetical protein
MNHPGFLLRRLRRLWMNRTGDIIAFGAASLGSALLGWAGSIAATVLCWESRNRCRLAVLDLEDGDRLGL